MSDASMTRESQISQNYQSYVAYTCNVYQYMPM